MADSLCAECQDRVKLEALFDDGPLLDEANAVLDPVNHYLRTDGQRSLAQRACRNSELPAQIVVCDLTRTTGQNLLRNHCQLPLDFIALRGKTTRIAQGPSR